MRELVWRFAIAVTLLLAFCWQRAQIVRQREELKIMRADLDRVQRTNEELPAIVRTEISRLHRELIAYMENR
ncbi:MAG: hypothetical protein GY820_39310 [Gammaproteobacteria bacterium]|nr:hypothetical protein [Gammaproteobacteria bacterium]